VLCLALNLAVFHRIIQRGSDRKYDDTQAGFLFRIVEWNYM